MVLILPTPFTVHRNRSQETTAGDDTLDSTLNYSFAQSTKVANQSKEVILP